MASFIGRIGQAWSGLASATVTVPVTTATVGAGSLLVGIGWATVAATVTSVTDTQGNVYVQDGVAGPGGTTRNAAVWRCANFIPLTVYDPATGTGDQITVTLSVTEDRGLSVIIDQFTGLGTPDVVAGFSTAALVNSFKLNTSTTASDVLTYTIVMPDFTINWVNPPTYPAAGNSPAVPYLPTGLPVTPVGGASLQAAYNIPAANRAGPTTIDWSFGPASHNTAVLGLSYPAAPNLAEAAAETDTISVAVSQLIGSAPSAILAPQMSFYSASNSTFSQMTSNYNMPINPATVYSWAAWVWQSFTLDFPLFAQINWYDNTHTFLGATVSSAVNSLTPALITVSGSATGSGFSTAAFATADIFIFGGTGNYPSPTHTYYAAAAQQTTANWIAVPGNTQWINANSVGGALAPWVAAYGPEVDYGACADGFSVVQELIV